MRSRLDYDCPIINSDRRLAASFGKFSKRCLSDGKRSAEEAEDGNPDRSLPDNPVSQRGAQLSSPAPWHIALFDPSSKIQCNPHIARAVLDASNGYVYWSMAIVAVLAMDAYILVKCPSNRFRLLSMFCLHLCTGL